MPFRAAFESAITTGVKTATSRTKRYGWPGDVLDTPFGQVLLTEVYQAQLAWIALQLWREEGCESPKQFEEVWRSLHRGRWDLAKVVWVHRFRLVGVAVETP